MYRTRAGSRFPLGATPSADGVNFSVFGRHAARVELLLYEAANSAQPAQIIALDPQENRSYLIWHVFVEGLGPGAHYAWRMDGRSDTAVSGSRFNPRKTLLDPFARGVTDALWDRRRAADPNDDSPSGLRAVVC